MENCPGDRRCLICRRALSLENSDSEKPVSNNTSLLQDFLNCFHANNSLVNNLSTSSCHLFCRTCQQFIAEWSSIQTQMTQLTLRAGQLKATLSALLLSAPEIQEQNHIEDVTEIINNRSQNSQQFKIPFLLQQTFHDIRNGLEKKYSVRVMLDKIPLPLVQNLDALPTDNNPAIQKTWDQREPEASIQIPVIPKIEPLLVGEKNDDEPWDPSEFCSQDFDEEYLPSEGELDDEDETFEQILGLRNESEEQANCDDSKSQNSVHSKEMKVKGGTHRKSNWCPTTQSGAIRVGPNKFKYNGHDLRLKDQDQCYYCNACDFKGNTNINSVLFHIRQLHYTAEDKIKFTAVKISDTEWLNGGKYKIIKVDKKFKCVSCGYQICSLCKAVRHINSQHVNSEQCPDQGDDDKPFKYGAAHDSDEEFSPSEDPLAVDETSQQHLGMKMETDDEEANDSTSQHSVPSKEINIKAKKKRPLRFDNLKAIVPDGPNRFKYKGVSFQRNEEDETYTCDACGFRSKPGMASIWGHVLSHFVIKANLQMQPVVIRDGPNRLQFNGYPIRLNDQDQCYYCGVCNFNCRSKLTIVCSHIREMHYTAEDKVKFTAVQIRETEWLYGGKFKITKVDEKKFKCVLCGAMKSKLSFVTGHIRTQHVNLEGPNNPDEIVPLPATGTPSVNVLTLIQGECESVPVTFNLADHTYTCGLCETQVSAWDRIGRHIRKNHGATVPCKICGVQLVNQQHRRRHMRLHRTAPMKCPTCNKQFLNRSNFKNHIKVHELGEGAKKFECGTCEKRFFYRALLDAHELLHTGEKPYKKCQICGEKFQNPGMLTNHRRSAHGIQPRLRRKAGK